MLQINKIQNKSNFRNRNQCGILDKEGLSDLMEVKDRLFFLIKLFNVSLTSLSDHKIIILNLLHNDKHICLAQNYYLDALQENNYKFNTD